MLIKFQTALGLLVVVMGLISYAHSEMMHTNDDCEDTEIEDAGDSSMSDEEMILTLNNFSLDDMGSIERLFEALEEAEMFMEHQTALIFAIILLALTPLVYCEVEIADESRGEKDIGGALDNPLSDDEISYALSDLSMEDLNALSQLIDVLNQPDDRFMDSGGGDSKSQPSSDELARFKRENAETPTGDEQGNSPNDENYMRQLAESFPNVVDQSNQDEKEKEHIRVKRK